MIQNHWLRITHQDSQPHGSALQQPVVVNHGVLCWTSGCESWCVFMCQWFLIMLHYYHDNNNGVRGVVFTTIIPSYRGGNRWLWIMVCYAEPVVVNHGLLCWASGCELLCVILCQWLWILVYYSGLVVVNHGVLCWAQWLGIMVCYNDSQPLGQHSTT
jgi:hypothetical protein